MIVKETRLAESYGQYDHRRAFNPIRRRSESIDQRNAQSPNSDITLLPIARTRQKELEG